jgi:hypothetical protein
MINFNEINTFAVEDIPILSNSVGSSATYEIITFPLYNALTKEPVGLHEIHANRARRNQKDIAQAKGFLLLKQAGDNPFQSPEFGIALDFWYGAEIAAKFVSDPASLSGFKLRYPVLSAFGTDLSIQPDVFDIEVNIIDTVVFFNIYSNASVSSSRAGGLPGVVIT